MKQKRCSLKACTEKHYAKGFCRRHYRLQRREHQSRWEKIKSNPDLYEHTRLLKRAWERKRIRDYKKHSDLIYFGGLREKTIQRDGERCVQCGMTRKEHYSKWNKDLHVNHIDHTKLNTSNNLETLCIKCHASKSHY